MIIYIFYILLFCLSGCSKIKVHPELATIKKSAYEDLGVEPSWQRVEKTRTKVLTDIDISIKKGLTEDDAIRIALQNNPELQAGFEEIGIAKADLQEAGFYTNPQLETIFRFPIKNKSIRTNIEVNSSIAISDFWQVPLRKQIAQDDLQLMTFHILRHVELVRQEASLAFYQYLYGQLLYKKTEQILDEITKIRDRIYYRHQFGYTNKLDMYYADIMVDNWKIELANQANNLYQSFANLEHALGLPITGQPLPIIQLHENLISELPAFDYLKNLAIANRPEIKVADLNIQKAKHTLTYQKSRIVENVNLGIAYERDFDKDTKGIGPSIGLDVPIFNTNSALIERAQFELNRAEMLKESEILIIQQEVYNAYQEFKKLIEQIDIYTHSIIPISQKAIKFTDKYYKSMQMNGVTLLDTIQTLYEKEKNKLELELKAAYALINLETAIGKRMRLIKQSNDVVQNI